MTETNGTRDWLHGTGPHAAAFKAVGAFLTMTGETFENIDDAVAALIRSALLVTDKPVDLLHKVVGVEVERHKDLREMEHERRQATEQIINHLTVEHSVASSFAGMSKRQAEADALARVEQSLVLMMRHLNSLPPPTR